MNAAASKPPITPPAIAPPEPPPSVLLLPASPIKIYFHTYIASYITMIEDKLCFIFKM